jgi:hypothetical protein
MQPGAALVRIFAMLALAIVMAAAVSLERPGFAAERSADSRRQIVLQWRIDGTTDISEHEVWALEDRLEADAAGLYEVDSHDLGSGVANIFLYATDAEAAIVKVIAIYRSGQLRPDMRIGVQQYNEAAKSWEYLPVFPRGLHRFELIY